MADDPNQVVVLTAVPTEAQAEMIVAALEARGLQARTTGALTSGLRAGAPGGVEVIVRQADLEQARAILQTIEEGSESS